jgi:membrane protease YdiL (CAAX protease family)
LVFLNYFGFHRLNAAAGQPDDLLQRLTAGALLVSIVVQCGIAGMVVAMVAPRVRPVAFFGLAWRGWPWAFVIGPAAVVAMWLVFGGMAWAGYFHWMERLLGEEPVQDVVRLLKEAKDPAVVLLMVVAAVVVAPVCEEIIFRGYLYPSAKRFAGRWAAALCSGLVFGAAHGSLAALLPLCLFGVVLAELYERTGSLWAPVAAHFFFNGATVALQLAARFFDLPIDPP